MKIFSYNFEGGDDRGQNFVAIPGDICPLAYFRGRKDEAAAWGYTLSDFTPRPDLPTGR